jgi:hypothetical protein
MRRGVVLGAVVVALAGPSLAGAATCDETREELRRELAIRPSGPEDPEAVARVSRLEVLFAKASPGCAKELYGQLGESDNGDELSSAFHYALATPSRARLRKMLRTNFEPYDKLEAAIEAEVGGAAEREHLQCWVEQLRRGKDVDARVIPWRNVCPQDEQSCPVREHSTDDELAAQIRTAADVERAKPEQGIFQFLDATAEMAVLGDMNRAADELLEVRRQVKETEQRLAKGGLPAHYAAMKAWIADQEEDPSSVLWCPQPLPAP